MHFERRYAKSKYIKLYFFPGRKKKCVCLPHLKRSDQLPETHFFIGLIKPVLECE